jgi:hypothetical protein
MRPRDAVTRRETGLTSTNASSPLGSVSGSTKMLLRKVSGNSAMKPPFITALGARSSSPTVVKTHASPNANATTSSIAASTPPTPPSGRKPSAKPTTTTTVPATR